MANAIMVLQELSVKLGWRLSWTTHPPVGPSHAPMLTVQVKLEGEGLPSTVDICGKAGNSKSAKQEAARQMLFHADVMAALEARKLLRYVQHLELSPHHALYPPTPTGAQGPLLLTAGPEAEGAVTPAAAAAARKGTSANNPNNFKGRLAELLMKANAKLRTLEGVTDQCFTHNYTSMTYGPRHHTQFVCTVTVYLPHDTVVEARGVGRVKRESEHIAAYHALADSRLQKLEFVLAHIKAARAHAVACPVMPVLTVECITSTQPVPTPNTSATDASDTTVEPGEVLMLTAAPHNEEQESRRMSAEGGGLEGSPGHTGTSSDTPCPDTPQLVQEIKMEMSA